MARSKRYWTPSRRSLNPKPARRRFLTVTARGAFYRSAPKRHLVVTKAGAFYRGTADFESKHPRGYGGKFRRK